MSIARLIVAGAGGVVAVACDEEVELIDGDAVGSEPVKTRWRAIRDAAPDLRTEIVDVLADGDRAVVRSRMNDGTGELFELLRIAGGRIVELGGARAA
jgi:predicted ester cyclase